MKNFFKNLKSLDKNCLLFAAFMMIASFCVSADYGIIRPACDAFFISSYTTKYIPYAWICALPVNFAIIYFYNRFLPSFGCFKIFSVSCIIICFFNVFSSFFIGKFYFWPFIQYIWKDIYILLMYKQLWSLIHSTLSSKEAKLLFGFIFGMGGIGSVFGGLISNNFALSLGSNTLLSFTFPVYVVLFFAYFFAMKFSPMNKKKYRENLTKEAVKPKEAFSLIKNSKLLTFVLFIVILMQLTRGFVDFQFSIFLEKAVTNLDLRTQYLGKLVSITNGITSCFQLVGSFLLIHFFGLKKIHLLVPLALGANALALLLYPIFPVATYSYIAIKAMDYSIFGIIREMLYIPMKIDEKYRAKTIIDVFAYRSARAITSVLIITIQLISKNSIINAISIITIFTAISWFITVQIMFKHYEFKLMQTPLQA